MGGNNMRRGSSRLFVRRGFAEGEMWALQSQFVPRRYFAMLVNPYAGSGGAPPETFDETYYLDTDAGGGGSGSIGSPWNTLEAARAGIIALHSSFVTDTVKVRLFAFGATDDTTAVTNTWPTSSTTYYLVITTPDADRKVQWDASVYTYARNVSGDTSAALFIGTNSFRLRGLQIYQTGSAGSNFCRPFEVTSLGGEFVADGVKFRGSGGSNAVCMRATGIGGRIVLRNCLAYGTLHGFLLGNPSALSSGAEVDAYNNTIIGTTGSGGEALQLTCASSGIARIKNNLMRQQANGISYSGFTTQDAATNDGNTGSSSASFVDFANLDLRLVASTAFADAGTNLSGVADFPFSDDASLYSRPYNGSWDIGMHEYRP